MAPAPRYGSALTAVTRLRPPGASSDGQISSLNRSMYCCSFVVSINCVTADSSTDHNWVDFWLDLLGHAMAEGEETERLLKVPAIRFRYANCGIKGCSC